MWDRRAMLGAGASLAVPGFAAAKDRRTTLNAMLPSDLPHLCYPLLNNRQMQEICGNINESLLLFDWQFKPHPNLARAFEVSPDGLTYTFHIQPGVRWHDGTPFTARDVVFSCDVMLRELNPRSRAALSRCESITAKDAMTVVFKLREPFNAFLLSLMASTAPMMPAHIYEGTDFRTNPFNLKPIGTGPFKFQRWSRGQFVHLVRNQDYWRGAPQLTDLYFRLCPTPEQRMVALETGAVDIGFADDIDAVVTARLLANPRLAASTKAYDGTGEITVMEMNQRRWPFSDVRFRRAFMHAVDREFLVKAINFGQGKVAHSPIPSTAPYHDDRAVTKYEYNPARARALLDEIGLKPKRGGVRFSFRMMKVPDGGGTWSRCCQYVRQAMAEVGLDMQLESVDWATFGRRSGNWEFDMDCNAYGEYGDPAIGTSRFFLSSNIRKGVPQSNIQGYVNPEVDALFAKASAAIQPEEAQRHYSDIQRILTRDVAMMWMFERRPNLFYNRRLRDVVTGPNGPCDGLGRVTLA